MNFELAIRAEFATQHLMHEMDKVGMPIDLMLDLGYGLMMNDSDKWNAIQKTYEVEINKCLESGCGNREGFSYKELIKPEIEGDL